MPIGCVKSKKIKDLYLWQDPITGFAPDCVDLTEMQKSVISYLRGNGFGELYVSAPSWENASWNSTQHHAGQNQIDFGCHDRKELYRAWEFMRRHWPGKVLLGLNDPAKGWDADIHLHVEGTWNDNIWAHGFEVTQPDPTTRHPKIFWNLNDKDFKQHVADAQKIYGWQGIYKDPETANGSASLPIGPVLGGAVGLYIGYARSPDGSVDTKKLLLFLIVGAGLGYVFGEKLDSLIKKVTG